MQSTEPREKRNEKVEHHDLGSKTRDDRGGGRNGHASRGVCNSPEKHNRHGIINHTLSKDHHVQGGVHTQGGENGESGHRIHSRDQGTCEMTTRKQSLSVQRGTRRERPSDGTTRAHQRGNYPRKGAGTTSRSAPKYSHHSRWPLPRWLCHRRRKRKYCRCSQKSRPAPIKGGTSHSTHTNAHGYHIVHKW